MGASYPVQEQRQLQIKAGSSCLSTDGSCRFLTLLHVKQLPLLDLKRDCTVFWKPYFGILAVTDCCVLLESNRFICNLDKTPPQLR